jgi:D-alanine-D-alanine ligase
VSRVAVLKGGRSLERQVSLRSAARVEDALERLGHEVVGVDVGADLVTRLRAAAPDVAFVALHGPVGEDGVVQELLEVLGVPYTGSGISASRRAFDKVLAKRELRAAGVPTPDFVSVTRAAFRELGAGEALEAVEARLGFPLVVKPAGQGSALGVTLVRDAGAVADALVSAFSYDDRALLERYVPGRELAVSVLDGEALPVVEAVPRESDLYDFEARYEIGRTRFVCPAELSEEQDERARGLAEAAWAALDLAGVARVDLMLAADGELVALEANTIPGFTDTSLLPMAAEAAGLSFDALVARVLELAPTAPLPR